MIELTLKEIFKSTPLNFVEIGSRDGHDTDYIRKVFNIPESSCYILEAHPDCYSQIKSRYSNYNVYNCAITNKTGVLEFNAGIMGVEDNIGCSSILEDASGGFKSNKVTVDGWRFDELCEQLRLYNIDLIKIDVEGHTKEVLEGFGEMLKAVKILQVELEHKEAWKGQALYDDIAGYLRANNFEQVIFIKHSHDQSDSIWANRQYYNI